MANCKNLIKPKQINKVLACPVCITGFTSTISTTDIVTIPLGTALSTAGVGSASVPLVVSANDTTPGIITTGINNRVELWDDTTKEKLQDGSANEVYGRLTEAAGVYTLSYYSLVSGSETPFTMDARDLEFCFNYRFEFKDLSGDCLLSSSSRNVNDDPRVSKQGTCFCEELTVTGLNTISNITYTPSSFPCYDLKVNGVVIAVGGSGPVAISGKVVTWDNTNFYDVEVDDCVTICYNTLDLS